jgi:hypothetical protein
MALILFEQRKIRTNQITQKDKQFKLIDVLKPESKAILLKVRNG